jgi:retron-type reverse transcriptase
MGQTYSITLSKVIEKVIFAQLLRHIKNNNILSNHQYGFRHNSSTELASYKLINEILEALNNKIPVRGIFCDLNKAFDSVNHDVLLSKLKFYGIVGKANKLLESYLYGRYQRVVTNSRYAHLNWG